MMMGPEPMMSIFLMSVRLGMGGAAGKSCQSYIMYKGPYGPRLKGQFGC